MLIATLLCVIGLIAGCWSLVRERVILIPSGEPVQLAECVEAYVYITVAGEKVKTPNRITIPAGWWCLPDPGPAFVPAR
jgi:hypothetical protein